MTYTEVLLPSISDMAKKTIEKEELSRKQSGPQRTMEKEAPPLSEHFPPQRWRALTIFAHQNFKSKLLWTIDCYVSQNSSFPNGSIILVMLCLFHHCTLGACNEHSLSFWLNQLVSRVIKIYCRDGYASTTKRKPDSAKLSNQMALWGCLH